MKTINPKKTIAVKILKKTTFNALLLNWRFGYFILAICVLTSFAFTTSIEAKTEAQNAVLERIGGTFTVVKISRLPEGGFSVDFKASEGAPKISRLHLESDHIHVGMMEGQTFRLSADVKSHAGGLAEISQVVVFIAGPAGPTPIWMMSKNATGLTPPARLLDMHTPSTDYTIF